MDNDGAYSIAKLLGNTKGGIKEIHIAQNKISYQGLTQIFDTLAVSNKKLKYLDVSENIIEIGILHSFRNMLEKNNNLQYLIINKLYKFNDHAIDTIADSLVLNKGLKLVDLK